MRAFVALGIPEPQRALIADHVRSCAALAPDLRWVPAQNLHLTLRFIGQAPASILATLLDALHEVPLRPFRIALGGAGVFGRGTRARVCWLGVADGSRALAELAASIEAACVKAGLPPVGRAYNPHLTLARARQREGALLPELPAPPAIPSWRVEDFGLYRSHPGAGGPAYERLATISI